MRRLLRILGGFVVAVLTAAVVQVCFALPPLGLMDLPREALPAKLESLGLLTLAAATHSAIFSSLFVLVVITVAEWLRFRSVIFYGLTGTAIAIGGLMAQFASENSAVPTILNTYAALAYGSAGFAAGFVYWLLAGRRAGQRRYDLDPRPRLRTDTDEEEPAATTPEVADVNITAPVTSVPVTAPKPLKVA